MKDLLWINRWDGRRKNSAKEKQTIGQSFISNYNIADFKQVLSELWVGLAMNIGIGHTTSLPQRCCLSTFLHLASVSK